MRMPLKNLKFNSLFLRIFSALCILALLLCIVFFFLIRSFMFQNFKENMREGNQQTALNYVEDTDREIWRLGQRMIELSNNSNVVKAAITPGINDQEHNEWNVQILSLLRNFAIYNNEVDSVILYEYSEDELYTSSDLICNGRDYEYLEELESLLHPDDPGYIQRNRFWNISLRNAGENLYLCMEFLYSVNEPLSALFVKLDKAGIFSLPSVDSAKGLYVFDARGKEIIHLGEEGRETALLQYVEDDRDDVWDGEDYLKRSPNLNWVYVMQFDSGFARLNTRQNLASLIPGILLLLTALVFAYSTSRVITRPISAIVKNMIENDESTSERLHNSRNEMEFLANEYQYSSQKESYMQSVLREISAEAVERTLLGLVEGKAEEAEVRKIIENTGSGFRMDGKYCMILAEEEKHSDLKMAEFRVFTSALEETLISSVRKYGGESAVLYKDNRMILLAGYAGDVPSRSIRNQMNSLYKKMLRMSYNWPVCIHMAISFVYSGINSLPLAYRDSLTHINSLKEQPAGLKIQEGIDFDEARRNKLAKLAAGLKAGDLDAAGTLFHTLLNEIRDDEEEETRKACCTEILKVFAEVETKNRIVTDPQTLHDDCVKAILGDDPRKLSDLLSAYGEQILTGLDMTNKKRQNRYVARAKEYIDLHYGDSNLSLTDVAEDLDLNKSYLSTLMNEVLETGFTDYLNAVRIAKVREMLDNSDMSVNEICVRTGFNSVQNFIRVFKKYVGMTPGQYRKKQGTDPGNNE